MQAVIMAGGKGTRLSSVTKNLIPKPMVSFCGKPLIERIVEQLVSNGIDDIVVCLGHLGEQISDYLSDGSRFGITIRYVTEDIPLGTAGALYYVKPLIRGDFVLVYADLMFDVDLNRMMKYHKEKESAATMFVHPNSHPYDSDLVICDNSGRIKSFDYKGETRDYDYDNCVNAGIFVFSKDVFRYFEKAEKTALESGLIAKMLQNGERMFAYHSPEYVKDVGTPERLESSEKDWITGCISSRNLKNKQKAVFMDRDGTVNKYDGLVTKPEQIELIDGVEDAIRTLNASGFLTLIVTNQPVIARGDCTEKTLDAINRHLFTLLGNKGVYIDDLVYCPHHPDKGFEGERPELKIQCSCRKPATGMIDYLVEKYNIDLSESWMVGDTYRDIQTGFNAGLKTILIPSSANDEKSRFEAEADYRFDTFSEAIENAIESRK